MSIESRKKISESAKGRIPWNKGKIGIYSKEALQKMSEYKKGWVVTKEYREKMSRIKKGIKCSESTKQKLSKDRLGSKNPAAKLNEMQVRIIKRLLSFKTLTQKEIASIFNVSRALICHIKNKKVWNYIYINKI